MKSLLFYDESFPYSGDRPQPEQLARLGTDFEVADAYTLAEKLNEQVDCLIHLHGPYFPKDAWGAILAHLKRGKGFVHMGGAPFQIPVRRTKAGWVAERQQTAYHQQLNIAEALPVDPAPIDKLQHNPDLPLFLGKELLFSVSPTYGLILHVTKADDHPGEIGSSGPMDAHIYPLLRGISSTGREVAAPAVLIENTKGAFAGGRWLMINQLVNGNFFFDGGLQAIMEWTIFCTRQVTEIWLKPGYACYQPDDRASLTLQMQTQQNSWPEHPKAAAALPDWTFDLRLFKESENSQLLWSHTLHMQGSYDLSVSRVTVPMPIEAGLYQLVCTASSAFGEQRVLRQGFWGWDQELLEHGQPLTCDRDYFWKEGRPLPIVGMTYMTSDVARKYLFLPNVSLWDRDIAQMKKAGINLIRTGIWTAHRHVMFVDGHPSEEVLRAIDAFILTAKKYDIEVTFNFFAFAPDMWEGVNPYLDPRSVQAQKRLIASVVSRHANTTNIHWDLINEPSVFNPKRVFNGPQPNHDPFERAAFIEWIKNRHAAIEDVQERWNMTPVELPEFSAVEPPVPEQINFNIQDLRQQKKGLRWLDFCLFSMEMHNRWALELSATIKAINPNQLVTVGQDEGLSGLRPSPFFYAEAVDYTTVHSWWLMDQLVWDGIFTKTPFKPNLVQETGIMYLEQADGHAKRGEEELRNILERKYAYAFSTGGAGAVQWIWNTNFYMDNVNESNIGALRADGTEKPEANVSYDFGRFIKEIRDLFVNRQLEEVVVIFPYSNDFSNRRLSIDGTAKLTRTLAYEMNVPFRALGEYHLAALQAQPPKLILVPSPHNFSDQAFAELFEHIRIYGGNLLFTGPLTLNEYWKAVDRLPELADAGITEMRITNVLREEILVLAGQRFPVAFGGKRIAEVSKQICLNPQLTPDHTEGSQVHTIQVGKGKLLWCPLPLELNDRLEPLIALYRYALTESGVEAELNWKKGGELPGIYGRKVTFQDGALFVFVSEHAHKTEVEVQDPVNGNIYSFALESERSILFQVDKQGHVIHTYRPDEVVIEYYIEAK